MTGVRPSGANSHPEAAKRSVSPDALVLLLLAAVGAVLAALWLMPHLACADCSSDVLSAHREAVSLSTFGKWQHPSFIVDGFSGEFPVFYNYLSSALLSQLAEMLALPPAYVQGLIYGPALVALMPVVNYAALRLAGLIPAAALVAALIVSACADAALLDWIYPLIDDANLATIKAIFHVPVTAMGVGSDQAFGWLLFLPTLALFHTAVQSGRPLWFALAGAMFGLMMISHTLTLINATTAASFYLFAYNVSIGENKFLLRPAGRIFLFLAVIIALGLHGRMRGFSEAHFVALWTTCWLLSIRNRGDIRNTVCFVAGALLLCGPYLWQLWVLREGLRETVINAYTRADFDTTLAVFLPLWLGAGLLFIRLLRGRSGDAGTAWLFALLAATLALAQGPIFGFVNHPYRFGIHLIFPLAALFGIYLTLPRNSLVSRGMAAFLGLWVAISTAKALLALSGQYPGAPQLLGTSTAYNSFIQVLPATTDLLEALEMETATGNGRLLLAPEYSYPTAASDSAIMLSHSSVRSFIADPRYIAWRDLHRQRVNVVCSLFPDYPHIDPSGDKACTFAPHTVGTRDGFNKLIIVDEAVRADILPVYGISLAADLGGAFSPFLTRGGVTFGWTKLYEADGRLLYRLASNRANDRINLGEASYDAPYWTIPFSAPQAGRYVFFAAGEKIAATVISISAGTGAAKVDRDGSDVLSFVTELPAGNGALRFELAPDWRLQYLTPSPLHFLTGVPENNAEATILRNRFANMESPKAAADAD